MSDYLKIDLSKWRPLREKVLVKLLDESESDCGIFVVSKKIDRRGNEINPECFLAEVASVAKDNTAIDRCDRIYAAPSVGKDLRINGLLYSLKPGWAVACKLVNKCQQSQSKSES